MKKYLQLMLECDCEEKRKSWKWNLLIWLLTRSSLTRVYCWRALLWIIKVNDKIITFTKITILLQIATQRCSQTDDNHVTKWTFRKFDNSSMKAIWENSRMLRDKRNNAIQRFLRSIANRELKNWISKNKQNYFCFSFKSRNAQTFIAFICYSETDKAVAARMISLWRNFQLRLMSFLFLNDSSSILKARIWQSCRALTQALLEYLTID